MSSLKFALCAVLLAIPTGFASCLPPKGAAAWVYDVKGGEPAMWAKAIQAFNSKAKQPISTIWSYGGDMEYYPKSATPYNSYFPEASQQEAAIYNQTTGVKYIGAVLDGRMDGGQSYSPDLSKLTVQQVQAWADATAQTYCSFDVVDGLQLDLEPSRKPVDRG